jgi:hypothetical protein
MSDHQGPAEKLAKLGFRAVTGTDDCELQEVLVTQVTTALPRSANTSRYDEDRCSAGAIAALAGIRPQDVREGMLAVQMVLVHNAAVESIRQAMARQTPEGQEVGLRQATRLMNMYLRQTETLDRHRGQGASMVNVENVNVHAGAQAVVGTLDSKSPRARTKVRRGPSTRTLDHQAVIPLGVEPSVAPPVEDKRLKWFPGEDERDENGIRRG